jgi:hypothetical protein
VILAEGANWRGEPHCATGHTRLLTDALFFFSRASLALRLT